MRLCHDTKLLLPTKFFFSAFDIENTKKKNKTLQTDMLNLIYEPTHRDD